MVPPVTGGSSARPHTGTKRGSCSISACAEPDCITAADEHTGRSDKAGAGEWRGPVGASYRSMCPSRSLPWHGIDNDLLAGQDRELRGIRRQRVTVAAQRRRTSKYQSDFGAFDRPHAGNHRDDMPLQGRSISENAPLAVPFDGDPRVDGL